MSILNTGLAKSSAADAYTIDNSLRFNDGDSPSLKKTFSAGDRRTWTWSGWVKKSLPASDQTLFSAGTGAYFHIRLRNEGEIVVQSSTPNDSTIVLQLQTSAVYRDPSAWYHIVVTIDTTDGTEADRAKVYVNGDRVTAFDTETTISTGSLEMEVNNTVEHGVGIQIYSGSAFLDSYLAEVYFIDGSAELPSAFGELNATTNQWKPIDASGLSFGTNGFYQKYGATELANSFTDSSGTAFAATSALVADVLVVAGGGGGISTYGGGGGAGGLIYKTGHSIGSGESLTVSIGTGGGNNASGVNTTIGSLFTAVGGGKGGSEAIGTAGGSGGGSSYTAGTPASGTQTSQSGDSGTYGHGYAGGAGDGSSGGYRAAGGGGAGSVGEDSPSSGAAGDGGTGYSTDIRTGVSTFYAAGGGGGGAINSTSVGGTGGSSLGGNGGDASSENGTNATGFGSGGGGGFGGGSGSVGGTGSDGIVVIRYASATAIATGGTITTYDDSGTTYQVHSFTDTSAPVKHTITAVGDVTNTRAVRKVGDSSIYFPDGSDYLSIPDSADWDVGTGDFTIEAWTNFTNSGANDNYDNIFKQGALFELARQQSTNKLKMFTGSNVGGESTGTLTDGTWRHVAVCRDSGTVYAYISGVEVFNYSDSSDLDYSDAVIIGNDTSANSGTATWYLDEFRFSNTARYPSGTTFTPSTTEFTADANTKLLIHSNWDGGLGADSSGNYNTFTPTNLVATDSMVDVPTNNFATLNPLVKPYGTNTYSEGNLKTVSGSGWQASISTISVSSGKWYYETLSGGGNQHCYIIGAQTDLWFRGGQSPQDTTTGTIGYMGYDGNKRIDTVDSSYGDTFTSGDIIAVALDLDAGTPTVTFYKNNVAQDSGTPITFSGNILNSSIFLPAFVTLAQTTYYNFGSDSSFSGQKTAQSNQDSNGKGDFYYEPPTDYLALCTDNLPSPEIALPGKNFNTVLYDDGAGAKTGVGFQPDLVWLKSRGSTYEHEWTDTVRGATKAISSDSTNAETTDSTGLTAFGADGFTVGADTNYSDTTGTGMVAWNWKAGGAPTVDNSAGAGATPTAGSVKIDGANLGSALAGSVQVDRLSANTTNGFSIVKFPGDGTVQTVGHGLSKAPELITFKGLGGVSNWPIGSSHGLTSWAYYVYLAETSAESASAAFWNDTAPTASVFTIGATGSPSADTPYIGYCFHSVEGYSKVGSYEGNGNVDGSFIYTGMGPAYILIKRTDDTGEWYVWDDKRDTINPNDKVLYPNSTLDEQTSTDYSIDFLSNGFKVRNASNLDNNSSGTYLYIAFAESPFKTSNAR